MTPQPPEGQAPLALLRPLLERWEQGELLRWDELFAPEMLVTGYDADGVHVARGPEEIGAYMQSFFQQFADYHIEVGTLEEVADDTVLMEGRQHGTGRRSGLEISETLVIAFKLANGHIAEMHWRLRRPDALEAVGR